MKTCLIHDLFAVRFSLSLILSSIIILLFLLLFPQNVYSFDITLVWNITEVEDLAEFRAFYREEGQEYDYNNPAWDGNVSTCTIPNLAEGIPYYFVVKAYSIKGDESDNSNEVRYLSTENLLPIADAGPDKTIDEGVTVILDGSGSDDPDGTIISYDWIQLTGTNVELVDSALAQANITAPDVGPGGESLTFQLTVTDDGGLQSTDTCVVNVSYIDDPPTNDPPVAEANGLYSGIEGQSISFSSTGSGDVNGDSITYNWNFGDNTTSTNANPSHTYAQNGTYTVTLTVSDSSLTDTDTATVTVSDIDPAVDFSAKPTTGSAPLTVNFTATATSYDEITSYSWNFGDGGTDEGESPRHTYTTPGTYTVSLSATESDGDTATETKTSYITVSVSNATPVAEAGDDQAVNMGTVVNIDGSTSEDPDGTIVSYYWEQISGPDITISDPMSAQTTFTAPYVDPNGGSIILQLTVIDNEGLQSTDTCTINVTYVEELPTLTSLSISGESSLNENSVSYYIATAVFSDGNTRTVTDIATWSEDSPYANINSTGELSTSEVTKDEIVTITANYNFNGVIKIAEKPVTIIDIPEPTTGSFKPVIASPSDGQTDCELMVHLTTLPFSDPNGNTHTQSQWQISKQEDFSTLVLDITSNEHLTELTVPDLVLEPETTYYVRARFFNSFPETSDWSDIVEFTTRSDINDANANGIPDDQEIISNTDLNEDGINDNTQPDKVKGVKTNNSTDTIALSKDSESVYSIEAMRAIDPSTISEGTRKPRKILLGLFAYRLRLSEPGITIYQRIYFSSNIKMAKSFYKYDTIYGWEDYSQYVTFDYKTKSIIIELTDGGKGDSDGTANGIIVDPGGLVEDDLASSFDNGSPNDNGSPRGGCFIESIYSAP